jgi:hypothetical protein
MTRPRPTKPRPKLDPDTLRWVADEMSQRVAQATKALEFLGKPRTGQELEYHRLMRAAAVQRWTGIRSYLRRESRRLRAFAARAEKSRGKR